MSKIRRPTLVALLLGCFHFFFIALPTRSAARAECISVSSKILSRSVPYCILLPPTYDDEKSHRYPILYLLHGLGDNDQFLIHTGGMSLIEDLWEQHEISEFLIVTPAAGASFYINSQDGKRRYEDFFLQEFMPAIEKRYRTQSARGSRAVAGISMGGYGALHLAFRHPQLFTAVGAHSAALLEKLPSINAQNSRQFPQLRVLGDAFGSPFDAAFWNQNDPITIAHSANLSGLKIYFDCGSEDDYGFESGASALDKLLTSRRIPHEFHLYPGGHDWTYFALHLPASLKFESHAFELPARPRAK